MTDHLEPYEAPKLHYCKEPFCPELVTVKNDRCPKCMERRAKLCKEREEVERIRREQGS